MIKNENFQAKTSTEMAQNRHRLGTEISTKVAQKTYMNFTKFFEKWLKK
jgi:phage antirepressor YoqD-like protein